MKSALLKVFRQAFDYHDPPTVCRTHPRLSAPPRPKRQIRPHAGGLSSAIWRNSGTLLPPDGELGRAQFVSALKKLSQQNLHPRSLARKLSVWRQYADYLVEHQLWAHNPISSLKAPKPPARLPKAVDQETLNQLLNRDEGDEALQLRDHALFELMYGSGLLSEIHGLDLTSILLDEGWVSVWGKGSKQRQVPLGRACISAIRAYLPQRQTPLQAKPHLFTNRHGRRLGQRQIKTG